MACQAGIPDPHHSCPFWQELPTGLKPTPVHAAASSLSESSLQRSDGHDAKRLRSADWKETGQIDKHTDLLWTSMRGTERPAAAADVHPSGSCVPS